jgi:uncharacterized protein YhdP
MGQILSFFGLTWQSTVEQRDAAWQATVEQRDAAWQATVEQRDATIAEEKAARQNAEMSAKDANARADNLQRLVYVIEWWNEICICLERLALQSYRDTLGKCSQEQITFPIV